MGFTFRIANYVIYHLNSNERRPHNHQFITFLSSDSRSPTFSITPALCLLPLSYPLQLSSSFCVGLLGSAVVWTCQNHICCLSLISSIMACLNFTDSVILLFVALSILGSPVVILQKFISKVLRIFVLSLNGLIRDNTFDDDVIESSLVFF